MINEKSTAKDYYKLENGKIYRRLYK